MVDYKIGDEIRIIAMPGDPQEAEYIGRTGIIKSIDSIGQLHGTWGGLAVIPEHDEFEVITNVAPEFDEETLNAAEDPFNTTFEESKDIVMEDAAEEIKDNSLEEAKSLDEGVFDKLSSKIKNVFKGKAQKEMEAELAAYREKVRKETEAIVAEKMAAYEKEIDSRIAAEEEAEKKKAEPVKPILLDTTTDSEGNEIKVGDTVNITKVTTAQYKSFEGKQGEVKKIARHPNKPDFEIIKVYFKNSNSYGKFSLYIKDKFEKIETEEVAELHYN